MNAIFEKGRESFAGGEINWSSNKIKAIIVDMNDAGPAAGAWVVSGCTFSGNTVTITTSVAHGLVVGDRVAVKNVGGMTNVDGNYDVATVPTTTTFTYTASTPSGTYTSGGFIANLSKTFLSEFVAAAGRVSSSAVFANKTRTNGVLDADDATFTSVTGDPSEVIIIVRAANADADADLADTAQRLIVYIDTATGLPVTPGGGNITVAWDNGSNRIAKL